MSIKDHVKGTSTLIYYRKGFLYYRTDDTKFVFRVPVEDTGDATFNSSEKSILLMRYIRKEIEAQSER